MKLRARIMLYSSAIIAATMLIISIAALTMMRRHLVDREVDYWLNQSYKDQTYLMTYLEMEETGDVYELYPNIAPYMAMYLAGNAEDCTLELYDASSNLVGASKSEDADFPSGDIELAVTGRKAYMISKLGRYEHLLLSCPIFFEKEPIGCIRYVRSLEKDVASIDRLSGIFLGVMLAASLTAIFMNRLMASGIVSPIEKLCAATRRISAGEFIQTDVWDDRGEIGELLKNFNEMSGCLEQYVASLREEKQKQSLFFGNVTHELKTPLTSIMGYAQMLDKLGLPDEKSRQCSYYIARESQRLYDLIAKILDLSKYMDYEIELQQERVEVYRLLEECVSMLGPRFAFKQIAVKNLVPPSMTLYMDRERNKELFLNLLDNCIKYSDCTELVFFVSGKGELVISDNGQGVSPQEAALIEQPFYRAKSHRASGEKGNGMGLSICKHIMERQKGRLWVESKQGSYFKVFLQYTEEST